MKGEPVAAGRLLRDGLPRSTPTSARSSRPDGWKLIYTLESKSRELYDLNADPGETKNLAEAEPTRADELERQLFAHFKSIGHDLTQQDLGGGPQSGLPVAGARRPEEMNRESRDHRDPASRSRDLTSRSNRIERITKRPRRSHAMRLGGHREADVPLRLRTGPSSHPGSCRLGALARSAAPVRALAALAALKRPRSRAALRRRGATASHCSHLTADFHGAKCTLVSSGRASSFPGNVGAGGLLGRGSSLPGSGIPPPNTVQGFLTILAVHLFIPAWNSGCSSPSPWRCPGPELASVG